MNQSSDSDSGDSDRGIRYKTVSTRSTNDVENSETNTSKLFGPALPPHLQKDKLVGPPPLKINEFQKQNQSIGPELPPNFKNNINQLEEKQNVKYIGPVLPPHMQKDFKSESTDTLSNEANVHSLQKSSDENEISNANKGILPKLTSSSTNSNSQSIDSIQNKCIGPELPDNLKHKILQEDEEPCEDEDTYGPLPAGCHKSKAYVELEERAIQMKIDMLNPIISEPKREEWMLELPAVKAANLGLGPRQFRAKEAPDLSDRSSWTDTPEDRAKKKEEKKNKEKVDPKKVAELREMKKRDKEQEEIARKYKRSKESLVDMHRKKMKKEKKEESTERRPFSREVDLQVNRFDEAQKKAVLKKAQLLDTRFSAGQSKFL